MAKNGGFQARIAKVGLAIRTYCGFGRRSANKLTVPMPQMSIYPPGNRVMFDLPFISYLDLRKQSL
jgi:hypothetical protein